MPSQRSPRRCDHAGSARRSRTVRARMRESTRLGAAALALLLASTGCSGGGSDEVGERSGPSGGSAAATDPGGSRVTNDDLRAALITVAEAGPGFLDARPQVSSDADVRARRPLVCGVADTTPDVELPQARVAVEYPHSTAQGPVYATDARPGGLRLRTTLGEQITMMPTEIAASRADDADRVAVVQGCQYTRPNEGAPSSAYTIMSVRSVRFAGAPALELVGRVRGPTKPSNETSWVARSDGSVVLTEWNMRQVNFTVGRFRAAVYTGYATESFDQAGFDAAVAAARAKLEQLARGSSTGGSRTTAPASSTTSSSTMLGTTSSSTTSAAARDKCGTSGAELSVTLGGRQITAGSTVEGLGGLVSCGYVVDGAVTGLLVSVADETSTVGANFFAKLVAGGCVARTDAGVEVCQIVQPGGATGAAKSGARTIALAATFPGAGTQSTADQLVAIARTLVSR